LLQHFQQPVMVDMIEEALNVGLHDMPVTPLL
jgi:hypothetical protein